MKKIFLLLIFGVFILLGLGIAWASGLFQHTVTTTVYNIEPLASTTEAVAFGTVYTGANSTISIDIWNTASSPLWVNVSWIETANLPEEEMYPVKYRIYARVGEGGPALIYNNLQDINGTSTPKILQVIQEQLNWLYVTLEVDSGSGNGNMSGSVKIIRSSAPTE